MYSRMSMRTTWEGGLVDLGAELLEHHFLARADEQRQAGGTAFQRHVHAIIIRYVYQDNMC